MVHPLRTRKGETRAEPPVKAEERRTPYGLMYTALLRYRSGHENFKLTVAFAAIRRWVSSCSFGDPKNVPDLPSVTVKERDTVAFTAICR